MSTTDTILASLTEQVRQLQAAIDWLDDHRQIIDKQCNHGSVQPCAAYIYLHGGRNPKELAQALGKSWDRDVGGRTVSWSLKDPKFQGLDLILWDTEPLIKADQEVKL